MNSTPLTAKVENLGARCSFVIWLCQQSQKHVSPQFVAAVCCRSLLPPWWNAVGLCDQCDQWVSHIHHRTKPLFRKMVQNRPLNDIFVFFIFTKIRGREAGKKFAPIAYIRKPLIALIALTKRTPILATNQLA
jgi:hypothetical protein